MTKPNGFDALSNQSRGVLSSQGPVRLERGRTFSRRALIFLYFCCQVKQMERLLKIARAGGAGQDGLATSC